MLHNAQCEIGSIVELYNRTLKTKIKNLAGRKNSLGQCSIDGVQRTVHYRFIGRSRKQKWSKIKGKVKIKCWRKSNNLSSLLKDKQI